MFDFIIAPDFPPDHFSAWHMLNTQLQRLSGCLIHLQTPSGCREQEELVAEGKAALVYANPFDAPALVRDNGYIPLAKPKGQAAQLAAVAHAASAAETAAALPVHRFTDAALVAAVDDLAQAGDDVGVAMLAQLDHDPAPPHLVGDGAGGA